MYMLRIKNKFVAKVLKYRIMFQNILAFLGLDFLDKSAFQKSYKSIITSHKKCLLKGLKAKCFEWTYGHSVTIMELLCLLNRTQ